MPKTPGFGERVRERLRATGYWNAEKNRPDVIRFGLERQYVHSYIYRWLKGETPRGPELVRLAQDLGVSVEWLVGRPAAIRRLKRRGAAIVVLALALFGSTAAEAQPLSLASPLAVLRLIGRLLRDLWYGPPAHLQGAAA